MRSVTRFLGSVLAVSGVLLLVDAALTVTWQEPVSALLAGRAQAQLEDDLEREFAALSPPGASSVPRERPFTRASRYERRLRRGGALGYLDLPTLDRRYAVVHGTDPESLRKGPGHYPGTALPGQGRTVAVAGHRTTYLAPFRPLDELGAGDEIALEMPYGRFVYSVQRTLIVRPDALWVVNDVGYERLVLTACHPLYSAARRIVVFARLRGAES
jgi:sortase A